MLSVWCSIAAVLSAVRLFEEVGRRKKKEKRKSRKGEKEQLRGRDLKVKKKRRKKKKKRKKEKKKKRKLAIQNSVLTLTSMHFSNSVRFKLSLLYTRQKKKKKIF